MGKTQNCKFSVRVILDVCVGSSGGALMCFMGLCMFVCIYGTEFHVCSDKIINTPPDEVLHDGGFLINWSDLH